MLTDNLHKTRVLVTLLLGHFIFSNKITDSCVILSDFSVAQKIFELNIIIFKIHVKKLVIPAKVFWSQIK